jgi:hypothetical protein
LVKVDEVTIPSVDKPAAAEVLFGILPNTVDLDAVRRERFEGPASSAPGFSWPLAPLR